MRCESGTVDGEHLFAALDAYLLVGLIFGVGYTLLDQISPESFGRAARFDLADGVYFSFVTSRRSATATSFR